MTPRKTFSLSLKLVVTEVVVLIVVAAAAAAGAARARGLVELAHDGVSDRLDLRSKNRREERKKLDGYFVQECLL